jgi:predicted nucleic acid-binding protein
VEVHSAIARGHRHGTLDDPNRTTAINRLNLLRSTWREISPTVNLREHAEAVLDAHPLRTADALQLAAALIWCRQRPTQRTFISADIRLCDAAGLLGFTVIQP